MSAKGLRVDKWLWTSRFFKTRSMAVNAIKGGKIKLVTGETSKRVKPASEVVIGNELEIQKDAFQFVVKIEGISERRVSAKIAQTLYTETESSIERRNEVAELLKAQPKNPFGGRKPDKHTLRRNREIKRGSGE